MPSLADLYSTIDSYKRRAADVLSDPQNSLMQMLGYANDRARNYNESLAQASKERGYGPKTQELAQAMAEAYNPVGITTWHGSPHTFNLSKGLYETTQEGPFLRVRPRNNQGNASSVRGIREEERTIQGNTTGSSGYDIPSRISDEEIKAQIKSPNNLAKQVADNYSLRTQGKPYALPQMEESSLKKQSAIGRTFMHAATEDPEYKKAIFEAYKKQMPELIEQHNIQNYDDLVNKSYKQLAKETEDQFREMPVNMSYHKNGEGNYKSSVEMLKDVHGNNHLYVYQGGDPHDFLNAIDPETGLNTNEKFRAIHDYFGHAVHGNTFGPMGEETAWGAHSQMFSPLAKLAMTAETRGQNSVVNYSPLNAELKKNLNLVEKAMASTKNPEDLSLLQAQKNKLWGEFQFAPQKSVILPPEFSDVNYKGGMPEYIQPLIKPNPETAKSTFLTHFSNEPNLTFTDPSRYGSGIAGAESERLKNYSGAVKDRSYFYTGNPEQVKPEPGLGAYKYISEANNLYDISQDPLKLRTLAQEANRTPWRSNVNAGQTYNVESDLERLIKEHGYQGYMTGDVTAPSAALFYKTPVTRYDEVLSKINQDVHSPNYLEDLHKALGSKFEYPREQAFKIAQENAALPVSEGGLGLPKDNTPEMRAKAMGYETPMYHGTNEDIEVFNTKGKGKTAGAGAFFTTNPTTAETYVSSSGGGNILPVMVKKNDLLNVNARGKNWSDIYTNQLGAKSGKIKYSPEELGLDLNSATTTDELGMIAADLGKKGIEIKNVKDLGPNSHVMRAKEYLLNKYGIVPDEIWSNVTGKQFDESQKAMKKFYESQKSDIVALQDPSMIRSKFAAFDPKQMGNPDLLAGVLPLSLGGATLVGANNDDVHSPNYLENLHKQLAQKPIDVTDVHAPNYLEDIHNQLANQQ
jgi:hypothetical protein